METGLYGVLSHVSNEAISLCLIGHEQMKYMTGVLNLRCHKWELYTQP